MNEIQVGLSYDDFRDVTSRAIRAGHGFGHSSVAIALARQTRREIVEIMYRSTMVGIECARDKASAEMRWADDGGPQP